MTERDPSSEQTPVADAVPQVAPESKRPWKAPVFEEIDYRITEATFGGTGGDNAFYS